MNKITLATFKAFCRKNKDKLYYQGKSDFDPMTDCVMPTDEREIRVIDYTEAIAINSHRYGYLVGGGRDYFQAIENGIKVINCCGSFKYTTK